MVRIGGKAQKLTAAVADAIFNLVCEVPPQTIDDNLHSWATELYWCENKPLHCPICFTSNSKTAFLVPPKTPKMGHFGCFWIFKGHRKWHFGCPNQNSKTTFQYKYPP